MKFNLENINRFDKQEVYHFLIYESHKIDKSHQLIKEHVFKSYFPELYDLIISDERLNHYLVFKQKLWHFFNNDYKIYTCPICGNKLKFISIKKGYQEHCSDKCRFNDKNYIEKVRKNTQKNWDNMSDRTKISEQISKGKKEGWSKLTKEERLEKTQYMRDVLEQVNNNRSDDEWEEINRKRVETWKSTYSNKSDEEKQRDIEKRLKTYKDTIKNRTEDDIERIRQTIKNGLNNLSDDRKEQRKINHHRTNIRNTQKLKPEVIDLYTPENSKNTIYTCKCTNPECNKCKEKIYKITSSSYRYRKEQGIETCPILHPRTIGISGGEKELLKYIRKIYGGEIVENCRSELDGLEIDIYLPELKIGFEFQGDLWHANPLFFDESFVNPINGKTYEEIHVKDDYKKRIAHERGIKIIEIWENDWVENNRKTKRIIKNIIEKGCEK